MTEEEMRALARDILIQRAKDVTLMDIIEMSYRPMTDDEACFVDDLILSARIRITWEDDNA